MAKKKVNKADAIRQALATHPDKKPMELADILKKQGVPVTPAYISMTKSKLGKSPKAKAAPVNGQVSAFEDLKKAKQLATELGGISNARAALDALAELTS